MRFSTFALAFGAVLCCALHGLADSCGTIPGNLVANCDFEDGTHTSTIPYLQSPVNSDPGVPNFWGANIGFIENYVIFGDGTDTVFTNPVTGTDYLSIENNPLFPASATLSQSLTDVLGATYVGDISESGSVSVLINGQVVSSSGGPFSFTGTGDDLLSLEPTPPPPYGQGIEGPSEVFDVVITPAPESVPEPRGTFLIPIAVLACLVGLRRAGPTVRLTSGTSPT